jgi:hypothetical protein
MSEPLALGADELAARRDEGGGGGPGGGGGEDPLIEGGGGPEGGEEDDFISLRASATEVPFVFHCTPLGEWWALMELTSSLMSL